MDKKKFNKLLGEHIRKHRESLGISQHQLASDSNTHINYIGSVERGEKSITVYKLYEILSSVDIDLNEFFEDL